MRKLAAAAVVALLAAAVPASARVAGSGNAPGAPGAHGAPTGRVPGVPAGPTVRAGVGITDATWHVGAGSGQYSAKDPNAAGVARDGEVDPHSHGATQRRSYGVHSRLTYRALVVEGANGKRAALVKSDGYLAQDMLTRRAAQILAERRVAGIGHGEIMLMASHNHSSPYYTTPSWGVWAFQDAFDLRAFEYHARQLAGAIEAAVADLRPARMGGTVVQHTIYKGQIAGGAVADDGTPAGYPDEHQDAGLTVLRFDDISDPASPKPLAVHVNHGQHPESLDAYDLITADVLAPLERMVERDLGAPLIFGQGDVGSAEGPYDRNNNQVLPDGVIRAWAHVGHAQTERGARYLADSVKQGWDEIGRGEGVVPFSSDFPVEAGNAWVPGPLSHPYPSVSNCRSETTVEGRPGSPVLGLPDCERGGTPGNAQLATAWENLKAHGVNLPEHYDAPGFTGVEENVRLHLQAFRLGEVLLASCACEAQMDLILNLESRLDAVAGNIFDGFDWTERCTPNAGSSPATWTCPYPGRAGQTLTVGDDKIRLMRAQVHNDARGWDAPENAVAANTEPADTTKIWGNFTKEELPAALGYRLPVGVGHATDYNGYTVSYREYMNRDHYRKALTSYGPHTADYMNTRLVRVAGSLKGGPPLAPEPHDTMGQADEARQEAAAQALGRLSSAAYDQWLGSLPDDRGPAAALGEPADITRFSAATFTWRGGSNAVDNPVARVERFDEASGRWVRYADQSGEVQTMVAFPKGASGVADTYAGKTEWKWTANFEAFSAFPRTVIPGGQVPEGAYRFVVDGRIRQGGKALPYHLESKPFHVSPWTGVAVTDPRVEPDGSVSFAASAVYPRTYTSPFRFVRDDGRTTICRTCSFRPWAARADVVSAVVSVTRNGGAVEHVPAARSGERWVAPVALASGDRAYIAAGAVRDANGEVNGSAVPLG